MKAKIAVVTGSNKGIGFEIVKQLAKAGVKTVLTARDEKRGAEAVSLLSSQHGLEVGFYQLDVTDQASLSRFAEWLRETFGKIDILVNNAGITSHNEVELGIARKVFETNYYGAKSVTEALVPLMNEGGRIINVSSRLGQLDNNLIPLKNELVKRKLSDVQNLKEEVIESCLQEFLEAVRRGTTMEEGYPAMVSDYCVSKYALNAYTRLVAPLLETKNIRINTLCPGYTKTDMTGWKGIRTVEEGADTAVWLALKEAEGYPSGKFFAERTEIHF